MPAIGILPKLSVSFISGNVDDIIDRLIEGGAIIARIYNDARSEDGTYYFRFVDKGRGPVLPIRAKALHWVDHETGKDVFAMHAKGVPPRHIVDRAIAILNQRDFPQPSGALTREAIAEFVNAVAVIAVEELQSITPVVTGKLRDSYRIEKASGG